MTYQIQSSFDENFKIIANHDPTGQNVSTSYQEIADSKIDYIPSVNSSFVIYHFSVHMDRHITFNSELNCTFQLQYSDDNGVTWANWGDNTQTYVGHTSSFLRKRSVVDLKWCLNASGWTSVKRLRVRVKERSGSSIRLHELQSFYDETGELAGSHKYACSVSCHSVE